jgi:hypothetical protein
LANFLTLKLDKSNKYKQLDIELLSIGERKFMQLPLKGIISIGELISLLNEIFFVKSEKYDFEI